MTAEDITLTLFTVFNALRIFGYFPQMVRSARDTSGGASTSIATWLTFFAANASATTYAMVNVIDPLMAIMFGLNALCCALIAGVTFWKRQVFVAQLPEYALAQAVLVRTQAKPAAPIVDDAAAGGEPFISRMNRLA